LKEAAATHKLLPLFEENPATQRETRGRGDNREERVANRRELQRQETGAVGRITSGRARLTNEGLRITNGGGE